MKRNPLPLLGKGLPVAIALLAITVSGCTKSSPSTSKSNSTPDTSIAKDGAKEVVSNVAPELPGVKIQPGTATDGFQGARADISDLSCKADGKGVWLVDGIVKNSSDKTVNYRIYTSFLSGTKTLGLLETDVENVKADASKKWAGSMNLDAEKVDCVLRVERVNR